MTSASERRERLARARLYFVTDASTPAAVLRAALEGGADMLQLRDPLLGHAELLRASRPFRALCDEHGALFFMNDDPGLARAAGADGVHVGQADMGVAEAREAVGGEILVGLSTHSPEQLEEGIASGADQLSVGPVWETPTKPGRPAAGLEYVRQAAERRPPVPWFAIGGIDESNAGRVAEAGAERAVVVRAIRDSTDPRAAAAALRAALERKPVGAAQ
ncbi:MAG: thiamine phosphate synthase [Thermoleophilaceae bacterium]|nr:thiamine phosphate synthase [Thermoleophilaceae bacterium]